MNTTPLTTYPLSAFSAGEAPYALPADGAVLRALALVAPTATVYTLSYPAETDDGYAVTVAGVTFIYNVSAGGITVVPRGVTALGIASAYALGDTAYGRLTLSEPLTPNASAYPLPAPEFGPPVP